jgi:tight adherence protein C
LAPLAAGLAAAFAALWLDDGWRRWRSRRRKRRIGTPRKRMRRQSARTRALAVFARRLSTGHLQELVQRIGPTDQRLMRSAQVADISAGLRELRGAQIIAGAATGLIALRLTAAAGPTALVPAAAAAWGGAMLPAWWLGVVGRRRLRAMRAVLPDALELTRACAASGLPLRRALAATAAHCREPLAGELRKVTASAAAGTPLVRAFEDLAARNPLPEIRALATAIAQSERHGAPLATVLAGIADDARRARERAIADRAAAAAPQIQLVVAALLVPAALLELAALLIAAIARGELRLL